MTNREILKKIKLINEILLNGAIYHAIVELENVFAVIEKIPAKQKFEEAKTTFNMMLEYYAKDSNDPYRENIYLKLRLELQQITDSVREYIKAFQVVDFQNIYAYYYQKVNLNSMMNKFLEVPENFEDIFKRIWLTDKISGDIKIGIIKFIDNPEIKDFHKSAIVSSVTLSLIRFFDERKFDILFDIYTNQAGEAGLRALVGIILGMIIHHKRIKFHNKVISRFQLLNEVDKNSKNIEQVMFQLIKSKETEGIIKEFEEHIMPEMMKMQKDMKDIKLEDFASENMMDDENPGWENFFDSNPDFLERMQSFTERQFDGSDIFSATLGNLKNFSFFQKISNWFLPFSSENQEVVSRLSSVLSPEKTQKFLSSFEKASYFCNSDKYSFCLHIPDIAGPMRETAVNMLMMEIDSAEEMLADDNENNDFKQNKDIITRYIQDLYRFFNFNNNFKGFKNIFKLNLSIHNTEVLQYFENKEDILRSTAELLFSKKFFAEASQAFQTAVSIGINEPDVYEKLAFSLQKNKKFDTALEYYLKAELFEQNKKWLYQKIGFTSLKTGKYQQALDYYKRAEELDNENITIQTFIGRCYIELENFEEALKYYFKADFFKPNNLKTMRSIAYASFKLKKYEQAVKYANKCIEIKGEKFDFFLIGDIYWVQNDKKEAIEYYKTAMSEFDNFTDFKDEFLLSKDLFLENNISEIDINLMVDTLEMKYYLG